MGGNHTHTEKTHLNQAGVSWLYCWEPRSKTIAAILFIAGVVSLQSLFLLSAVLLGVILIALTSGLSFKFLLGRLLLAAPFLLLMAVPIVLGSGFPPAAGRLNFAGLIVFKALTSIAVMTILLKTQPIARYFNGLAHMKLPPVLVAVLFLAHRYLYLFGGQLKKTQQALSARLFQPALSKRSLAVYGETTGGLLLKSLDRSNAVTQAMAARGFDGRLRTAPPLSVTAMDYLKCGTVLLITALLIIIDWRWLV